MKKIILFIAFLIFSIINNQYAQQSIFSEDFEDANTPQMQYCDDPGMALNNDYIPYWTPYNYYPGYMDIRCTTTCSNGFSPLRDAYSGNNAIRISATGENLHIDGQGICSPRNIGSGICYYNSDSNDPDRLYFGIGQRYVVKFKARFAHVAVLKNDDFDKLIVGYRVSGEEIPSNNDSDCKFVRYIPWLTEGIVQMDNDVIWKEYKGYLRNDYYTEDPNEIQAATAYQLIIKTDVCRSDCGSLSAPVIFLDDVSVNCDPENIFMEIKEKVNEEYDEKSCTMVSEYRVGAYYNCIVDFDKLHYMVEVIDNSGNVINSFDTYGEYFSVNYSIFDNYPLKIRVTSIVNDSDEKKYNFYNPDEDTDLIDIDFLDDYDEETIDGIQENNGGDVHIYSGQDVVWDNNYKEYEVVNGNLYVHTGGKLTIKNIVKFSPNSHLIVSRGAKLVLDHGILTSCDQWPGIIVKGNSTASQPDPAGMPGSDQAGIVITKNRSIIENAHIGISTSYFGQWTDEDYGGLVQCTNTDFIGCWKAVEFMSYAHTNKSFLEDCRIGGGTNYTKEGVTIWDCKGIHFYNCYMHDLEKGISSIDADIIVRHGNTFDDCEYGILCIGSSNGVANIDLRDNNHFNNNEKGIVISGLANENGGDIIGNYFEGCWKPVEVDGDGLYHVENNNFTDSGYDVLVYGSGDHPSYIMCNDMVTQIGGIAFAENNSQSYFKSNNFVGSSPYSDGFDVLGMEAKISDIGYSSGNTGSSAKNLFSGITNEIDWDDSNEKFNYYVLHDNPPPRTIPHSEPDKHNYEVKDKVNNDDDDDCNTVDPPTVTKHDVEIAIDDYCYWLELYRRHPDNPYYRWMFRKAKSKLMTTYYYWLKQDGEGYSWREIEDILKRLCDDRWKVMLYGHYMKYRLYSKADSLLNVLEDPNMREAQIVPEDLSDESRESFVRVQRINLKYQTSHGSYQLTSDELAILQEEAVKPIPESAYAKGLYFLATGIYIPREWPDRISDNLQPRDNKAKGGKEIWSIYPNPTDSELHIAYHSKEDIEGKVIIYDLYGSKAMEKTVSFIEGSDIFLNVSSLKSGVYIITVKDADNRITKVQKLMINSIK